MLRSPRHLIIILVALAMSSCSLFENAEDIQLRDSSDTEDMRLTDAGDGGFDEDAAFDMASDLDAGEVSDVSAEDMPDQVSDARIVDMPQEDMAQTDAADAQTDMGQDMGDPFAGRVTNGLSILLTFSDPTNPLTDESQVAPALPFVDRNGFDRLPNRNGIHLTGPQSLISGVAPAKFYDAVATSEEFTLELWVKPDVLIQGGPARVVTFSTDGNFANLMVGHGRAASDSSEVTVRVRNVLAGASEGEQNVGNPSWYVDTFQDAETQYVVTYSQGVLRFYRNGIFVVTQDRPVDFTQWNTSFHMAIGDEVNDPREWAGEVYLVAAYDRALAQPEIFQNFQVGSYAPR